jgi:hypothetical protein
VGGAILLVWGALGVFGAISTAVNHAWGVEKSRSFWSHRMFSFLMLLAAGLMLMIGLLGATAAQIIGARWFAGVSESYPALRVMQGYVIRNALLLLPALVFGLIYYFVPNVKVLVKDVWLGALITGLLWDAGFTGFAWFVRDVSQFTRIHGSISLLGVFFRCDPTLGRRVHGILQQDAARHQGRGSSSECLTGWQASGVHTSFNTRTTRCTGIRGATRRFERRASSTSRSSFRSAIRRATGAT